MRAPEPFTHHLKTAAPARQQVLPQYTYYGFVPAMLMKTGRAVSKSTSLGLGTPSLDIYDGDTPTISIDLGFGQWIEPRYYRLYGINSPEIHPLVSRQEATESRDHLQLLLMRYRIRFDMPPRGGGVWIIIKTHKNKRKNDYRPKAQTGKYGRWLVELYGVRADALININQKMVHDGYAKPYYP
jgi:endonuclease YncB( thermonuclease family)